MVNITKKILEDEVKLLNKRNIKLVYADKVYNLLCNDKIIFTGNAKETYIYLQGLKYGLHVLTGKKNKSASNSSVYNYFKNKVEKGFIIEAKKTAYHTCFSRFYIRYYINIERLTPDFMYFTAKMNFFTSSGVEDKDTWFISMRTIKLDEMDSIDKIGEKILRSIDAVVLERVKEEDTPGSDGKVLWERVLWLTEDAMCYLGWGNPQMSTIKVEFKVI